MTFSITQRFSNTRWQNRADVLNSVATARCFSQDLGFFCLIWGSGVFIENLGFFDFVQILEMYVILLYFPLKNTVVSQAQ